MGTLALVVFVDLFVEAFNLLILARIVWSWFAPINGGGIGGFLFNATEPLLAPVRKVIPPLGGMIDLAPIVMFFLLQIIQMAVHYGLSAIVR
jgi:YggT family protein